MNMKKSTLITFIIVVLSFAIGVYFLPLMPNHIASHWNAKGEVDGYMPKFFGLFLMPIISLVMFFLFMFVPKMDPLKGNVKNFKKEFDGFMIGIFLFMFYLYILTIIWNLGITFKMIQLLAPAIGLLFYYSGILIGKSKRNWFIGIKNPWTLSNDKVWLKTHKVGGSLFKIAGVVAFGGIILPNLGLFLILFPVLFFTLYLTAYSYLEYKRVVKESDNVK